MADGIRLDLQRALAEGPGAIPNLEPLFSPGSIPPVFPAGPEEGFTAGAPQVDEGPGFVPGGGIPAGATATFPGEPIDIGNAPIGSPVPPARRENRIRALLGGFLQNFGEGLQAASRAPSGAEFAAGFGAALSEPEARRQQQVFEDLNRANQALKRQIAEQTARFQQETLDAEERTRQAGRIERQGVRAVAGRRRFEDILTAGRQRTADIVTRKRERRADREFELNKILLQDELTRQREGLKPPSFSERRAAQGQRVNQMGAAFLVQSGGDIRAAIKFVRERAKEDPNGFTAKNFAQIMRAIRTGSTNSAIDILLDTLRQQPR